jgi:uncharacterized membrane protein
MQNNILNHRNWHQKHTEGLSLGQKIADKLATGMGSWRFIIIQSFIVLAWIVINLIGYFNHWDPYPFILLNLLFSTQAAYAAPIIMMSQNRQNERDRLHAETDFRTNVDAKKEIEEIQVALARMESEKLDKILQLLEK